MTAEHLIRPISDQEFPAFYAVNEHAFNAVHPTKPELAHARAVLELDRSLAAFDGPDMVGTAAALSFQLSVPGGAAAVAGVTAVSVLPSHRRRGILSGLMHRQLADIRDRGEAIAALFATEAGIYGRYGYGRDGRARPHDPARGGRHRAGHRGATPRKARERTAAARRRAAGGDGPASRGL